MCEGGPIQPIRSSRRPAVLFLLLDIAQRRRHGVLEFVAFHLIQTLQRTHRRRQQLGWLVQDSSLCEGLILNCPAVIVREHATLSASARADHNVTKAYVVLRTRSATGEADHQSDADIWKAVQHV